MHGFAVFLASLLSHPVEAVRLVEQFATPASVLTSASLGDILSAQPVGPEELLRELHTDNHELTGFLRAAHEVRDRHNDAATASLIENWIGETALLVPR